MVSLMTKSPIEIYRSCLEALAREFGEQFHWLRVASDLAFAAVAFVLDKTVGGSWLTIAFTTYLFVKTAMHGTIALSIRSRTGKWPGPRLYLALINLSVMVAVVLAAWRYGGASNTTALIQIPLFLIAAFTSEYFSDYRRNKRVVHHEFARFTKELGISDQ